MFRFDTPVSRHFNRGGQNAPRRALARDGHRRRKPRKKTQPDPETGALSYRIISTNGTGSQKRVSTRSSVPFFIPGDDTAGWEAGADSTLFRPGPLEGSVPDSVDQFDAMQVDADTQRLDQQPDTSDQHPQASSSEPTHFAGINPFTASQASETMTEDAPWVAPLLSMGPVAISPPRLSSNTPEPSHTEMQPSLSTPSHFVVDSSFSEEAWPVIDQRRTYDVAGFLNWWRDCSPSDLSALLPTLQQEVPLRQPRSLDPVISPAALDQGFDVQGLRWDASGPSRRHVLAARRFFHPLRKRHSRIMLHRSVLGMVACNQYAFRNYTPQHRTMFGHYQLRHALAASGRHDVCYAANGQVWRTALACPLSADLLLDRSKTTTRMEGLQITCLSAPPPSQFPDYAADNALLVGGLNGEYFQLNANGAAGQRQIEGTMTSARNGLVTHIHQFHDRRSGLAQASFCSNEGKVRLMDVSRSRFTDTFSFDDPINLSATSPDGRLRALVGDMNDVFVTDASNGEVLVTLRQHDDHGFACAWSPNGRHVATAAEDDTIAIWDARNWSRPVDVRSNVMSCARSLHFTDGGALVVAENEDIVSIYSGSTFNERQDLRFFGSIAGVALISGGEEIVIANCDRTVGGLLTFKSSSDRLSRHY